MQTLKGDVKLFYTVSEQHKVAIQCKDCEKKWRITFPLTKNKVGSIASMCECGAIIVGNYNNELIRKDQQRTDIQETSISKDEKYLTNGHFEFLEMEQEELTKLPELKLEE